VVSLAGLAVAAYLAIEHRASEASRAQPRTSLILRVGGVATGLAMEFVLTGDDGCGTVYAGRLALGEPAEGGGEGVGSADDGLRDQVARAGERGGDLFGAHAFQQLRAEASARHGLA
jgi:hypothetical protein